MLQNMSWIFAAIALYGTYLNSNQDKSGFYWWIVSNLAFGVINLEAGQYAQSTLFFVYAALAIRGLVKWD